MHHPVGSVHATPDRFWFGALPTLASADCAIPSPSLIPVRCYGYPESAIESLTQALGVPQQGTIVELGAGTGSCARQLAAAEFTVTAVEPSDAMRSKIPPSDRIVPWAGSAESTGLPDGCADAVLAATAWHWFDAPRAITEVRRLLVPGMGGLGLVWNLYDESVPWVAEYADISYRRRPASTPSARDGTWRGFFETLEGWEPLQEARIPNPQITTPVGLIDRLSSSSVIAGPSPHSREQARRSPGRAAGARAGWAFHVDPAVRHSGLLDETTRHSQLWLRRRAVKQAAATGASSTTSPSARGAGRIQVSLSGSR